MNLSLLQLNHFIIKFNNFFFSNFKILHNNINVKTNNRFRKLIYLRCFLFNDISVIHRIRSLRMVIIKLSSFGEAELNIGSHGNGNKSKKF